MTDDAAAPTQNAATATPDARRAAKIIHGFGCKYVLIKGGHLLAERATDLLYDGRFFHVFKGEFIDTPHTHGTGCTLSSAIATLLGHGLPLEHAVRLGRQFVIRAIEQAPGYGEGHGPLGHQAVRSLG